jgi:hypothetical protein
MDASADYRLAAGSGKRPAFGVKPASSRWLAAAAAPVQPSVL